MSSYLRPDEESSQSIIRRANEREGNIKRGIKTAAALGFTSVLGATGIASKILPFLNQYIPADLAMKGINKVAPKIGEFLRNGVKNGLDIQGGLDYLKEQFTPQEKPAKENRNIIQQYSPELHEFITQQLGRGMNAIQAGALAQNDKRFKQIISKLQKDHKTPWSNILEGIYGGENQAQPQGQQEQFPIQDQNQQTQESQAKDQLLQAMQALSQQLRS